MKSPEIHNLISEETKEESKKPNTHRAAKVINNLATLVDTQRESPNKIADTNARLGVLKKMNIHDSWYGKEELAKENAWFNLLEIAERMTDKQDPEFGKYEKARRHSGIDEALVKFNAITRLNLPRNEESDRNLKELKLAILRFKKRKEISDLAANSLRSIFK